MYYDKYFTKYCENAERVQHGSGLPYNGLQLMTGISNTYSSVIRNVANIVTIILSLIATQLKTIARVKH